MNYINGTPRSQLYLFEEKLDNVISEDNPVRFIDAFVSKLDINSLGFKIPCCRTGRPPYNPELLLKIYVYGYLNRLRSSRKLETECNRNVELWWLTERLAPDFKTIADFRKTNRKALKNIFHEFLKLCHKLELLSFKYVAIDGTKMRSQNSLNNIYKRDELEKIENRIKEKIKKYLEELDLNDDKEKNEFEFLSKNISEKIKKLKNNKDKINLIKKIFDEDKELKIHFANDPDSKFQKDNGRTNPGYNCQTAVDEKNNLIVAADVTNENNDSHQLGNMKEKIVESKKKIKKKDEMTILATDAGYYNEEEILETDQDQNFDVYVVHPRDAKTKEKNGKNKKKSTPAKGYEKDKFIFDIEKQHFICPNNKILKRRGKGTIQDGLRKYRYICQDCLDCSKKHLCTTDKNGRTIQASEHVKEIMLFRKKCNLEFGKKVIRKRKEVVEHPFGTIKRNWGYRYFMQKGLENVQSEFNFIAFIYNFKRVLSIIPMEKLLNSV